MTQEFLLAVKTNNTVKTQELLVGNRLLIFQHDCMGKTGLHWAVLRDNNYMANML
jgi:ankyrin repeat protein